MSIESTYVGLRPGSYSLDGAAIIDQATGQPAIRAERRSGTVKKDRYYLRVRDNNLAYFMYDKTLGSLDDQILTDIAWSNINFAQDVGPHEPCRAELQAAYYELAASAFTEAAFVQTFASEEIVEGVDERLALLDLADECLELAIAESPTEQTSGKHRLQIKQMFSRTHRDVVCGEITEETADELVQGLYDELMKTFEDTDEVHARGLAGEIRSHWHYWSEFKQTGVATIPATVRGDSGFYNSSDTHDFDVISQRADGNWQVETPKEIKRRRITKWMLDRYTGSDLVYVNPLHGVITVQKAKTA